MKARIKDDGVVEKESGGRWIAQMCHKQFESGQKMCSTSCVCCHRNTLQKVNEHRQVVGQMDVVAIQCVTPNIVLEYDNGGIIVPSPLPAAQA
jgi:hypothetical protein